MSEKAKPYYVWPTHWAGGSRSYQIDGHNTIWIEGPEGEIARIRPDNNCVTERTYTKANRIVDCLNACEGINPAVVPDMLGILKRLSEKVQRANDIQHSGGDVLADDWAELFQLTNEAKSVIEAAETTTDV